VEDSATHPARFETLSPLALEAAFDGGRLTSDGGLIWLAQVDQELELCEEIAHHVPEWRGPSVGHTLTTLTLYAPIPCSSWFVADCRRRGPTSQANLRSLALRMPSRPARATG
jgi:hypothetical protein